MDNLVNEYNRTYRDAMEEEKKHENLYNKSRFLSYDMYYINELSQSSLNL